MGNKDNSKYVYLKDRDTWAPCEILGQIQKKGETPMYLIVSRDDVLKVPVENVRKTA